MLDGIDSVSKTNKKQKQKNRTKQNRLSIVSSVQFIIFSMSHKLLPCGTLSISLFSFDVVASIIFIMSWVILAPGAETIVRTKT